MDKMIELWNDRRVGDMVQKITLAGVVLTMLIQISAGVWWASKIDARMQDHTLWIDKVTPAIESIAIIEKRVCNLEDNTNRLILKLDKLADILTAERINNAKKG